MKNKVLTPIEKATAKFSKHAHGFMIFSIIEMYINLPDDETKAFVLFSIMKSSNPKVLGKLKSLMEGK